MPSSHRSGPSFRRLVVALVALIAALVLIGASFATWLRLPDGAGGMTSVDGWGGVGGGAQIAGENLNDAMAGQATFRPGLIPLLAGGSSCSRPLAIAVAAIGRRPHRIPAAVLVGAGLLGLGWGIWRAVSPDSAGVLESGEGSAGWGQWLTMVGAVLALATGIFVLAGRLDPPDPVPRAGIQP